MIRTTARWRKIVIAVVASLGVTASVAAVADAGAGSSAKVSATAPADLGRAPTKAKVVKRVVVKRPTTKKTSTKRRVPKKTTAKAVPIQAPAPTVTTPPILAEAPAPAELTPQQVGEQALARLASHLDPAKLGVEVNIAGTNPNYLGLFESAARRVNVYVRPGQSVDSVAWVLAHELGHAVDVLTMTSDERVEWATARGYDVGLWWPGIGAPNDQSSGAGDFAECVAAWLVGTGLPFRSALGPVPSPAQIELLDRLTDGGR